MARQREHTQLRRHFRKRLSPQRVWREARETRFLVRQGKINPFQFVWTLILGFACGRDRTVSGLRRAFQCVTGIELAPSSFYERFGPALVALLRRLIEHVIRTMAKVDLGGELGGFADVVVADASVIRLRNALEASFPACRTNHTKAAMKLHLVMSATGVSSKTIEVTGERVNDRHKLRVGPWVKDRLLLVDLGYYGYRLFDRIDRNEGFFVSRLKANGNPRIVSTNRKWRGRAIPLVGERLQDVLGRLERSILDVEVEVEFRRRRYRGRRSRSVRTFRLIAVRDQETGEYHAYLTNVPAGRLSAEQIALAYRVRWQVELMFKACKSEFRLDHLPSRSKHVVEALVYASILTMLVTQTLLHYLRSKLAEPLRQRITLGRTAAALRAFGHVLLGVLLDSATQAEEQALEGFFLREATDPHLARPTSLTRAGLVPRKPARQAASIATTSSQIAA